jgi:ubiquinone/menaquinone biosynthesis C-methylase UbiE
LLHVADPEKVVKEMARVVKPSGRVVVMDWDFDTVVVDHSNRELTRRLIHWRTDHVGGNNWSGRKLFRYLANMGLTDLQIYPVVSIARSEHDSLTQSLWNAARNAQDQMILSAEEYEIWTGELKSAMKAGQFFASIVYFIVSGKTQPDK